MDFNYIFLALAIVFMGLTFFSMLGGFSFMMKGTEKSNARSNKFMQMRILFQALAVVCLALSLI